MEMNTEWIDLFEREDNLYGDFYKTNVETINVSYIYVNEHNKIFYIDKTSLLLEKNSILTKEKLIYLIQSHKRFQNKRFKPISILQYNYTIDSNQLINSINSNINMNSYITNHHYINNIKWEPTISFMSDLNELIIVFYYDPHNTVKHNTTRRIRVNMQSDNKHTRKRT